MLAVHIYRRRRLERKAIFFLVKTKLLTRTDFHFLPSLPLESWEVQTEDFLYKITELSTPWKLRNVKAI